MLQGNNSARERLEQVLARLDGRQAEERAFVKLYPHKARAEADAADVRMREGRSLGPLDGRLISVKDLFDVAGEPTLAGSIIRRDAPSATRDAIIIERLRQAGAMIVGKTHMTEFAFTAVGLNPHYPVPGNATDAALIPGGSSSGAAVSAAEGTCEVAIGSDTGGSVRIPAALNGLVGFKPSAQRIPLDGAFPLAPNLDSIGPLARYVADCAMTDAIMAGETPLPLVAAPLAGATIGVPRGKLLSGMEPAIARAYDHILGLFSASGATLTDFPIDDLLDRLAEATAIGSIAGIEASHIHAGWLGDTDAPVDIRVKSTLVRRLKVPQPAYEALLRKRGELVCAMDERLSTVDMLAMPTTPITAVPIASVENNENEYRRVEDLLLRNTQVVNQFDFTAITLPMPEMERPAGLMLAARNGSDRRLFGLAATVETLLGAR
ncbi:MAG: amidase [Phyllobacterium sp.]